MMRARELKFGMADCSGKFMTSFHSWNSYKLALKANLDNLVYYLPNGRVK